MRLIDADALMQSTDKESVHMWQIALAPTVDAVPLEDYRSMEQTVNKLTKAITEDTIKHGHWVYVGHGLAGESICKCSICGHQTPDDGNYCSYCGAKMDEVTEDDTVRTV